MDITINYQQEQAEIKIEDTNIYILVSDKPNAIVLGMDTNQDWKIENRGSIPGWITVGLNSGHSGKASISINIAENENYDDREGQILFSGKKVQKTVTIHQQQKNVLYSKTEFILAPQKGLQVVVVVNSSVKYGLNGNIPDWIKTIPETKGLSIDRFSLSIGPNSGQHARSARLTFAGEGIAHDVVVVQAGENPLLDVFENDEIRLSCLPETFDLVDKHPFSLSIQDAGWLKIEKADEMSFVWAVTADENKLADSRMTILVAQNLNGEGEKQISVSQEETSRATIRIYTSAEEMAAPLIEGQKPVYTILWGDGTESVSPKPGEVHRFSVSGEKIVTCTTVNVSAIEISEMTGISNIDLKEWLKQ